MVKMAYKYSVDPVTVLLLRMLFSFPFYLAIAIFYKRKKEEQELQKTAYIWIIIFGFTGYYLASYFDFIGLSYIKASLERIILFIYPTVVLILNKLFLKRAIGKRQVWAIMVSYIGIVIAFWDEIGVSGSDTYLGIIFVLLSAFTYASYLVGSGWFIPKFGVIRFTSYAMLISCICVFIHYGLASNASLFSYPWQVYLLGLLIAVFATVIPSYLVSASIKQIGSSNFAVVAGVGPISTILLAILFLNEELSYLQLLGTAIVIAGILILSKNKNTVKSVND